MTMTDEKAAAGGVGRRAVEGLVVSGGLDGLFEQIDAGQISLTGADGLLPALLKETLERGLQAELTDHLGYDKGERAPSARGNARNGTSTKTMDSEVGPFEIEVPRDRAGTFTPRLVRKGQRRMDGLDGMIISLYAGGMTVREIRHHLDSTLGAELNAGTISNITDAVADAVLQWQSRPLEEFYPVIHLDAIRVKIRDGGRVSNKAAHIAVGVDMEGVKHVLGIRVQADEGASFWARVCAELANRGVADVLIVCCDGLTGLPEAIEATWPDSMVQTCVVHLIRSSMRFVSYQDRKKVAAALKPIHTAANEEAAGGPVRPRVLAPGGALPRHGGGVGAGLGEVHPVPGVPAGTAPRHLHHQLDRVAELSAAQGHQEPRSLPQRCRGHQAVVAGDLQHRGPSRHRESQGDRRPREQEKGQGPPRPRTSHQQLEAGPRPARHRPPRPHQPLPLTNPHTQKH